jgi:hypothetical protein
MLAKILPGEHRVERHYTAVGRAEDGSKDVALAKATDEDVGTNRQSLDKKARDQNR